ncbi:MAG: hypothetical protein AUG06_05480 [Actinobacteria bacterium 13_1_20CM_2_65_11]|nr:MAG: hypothetical protein AUG06_05480 [Actinobacteria bacterium 13_1_20CM_2_65_11]
MPRPEASSISGTSYIESTSGTETTASRGTSVKSAIFSLRSASIGSSERQMIASGWIPMARSACTECWVGLVFISWPRTTGTSEQWM